MSATRIMRTFPVPLHRLNNPQYTLWFAGGYARLAMARAMLRLYPRGFGIVCPQPHFWTHRIDSRGRIDEMPRPYQVIEFWELANQPGASNCQCQAFVDHESKEPWGARRRGYNDTATHHPFCQYDPVAAGTFEGVQKKYGTKAPERPDAWNQEHQAQLEKAGLA